MIRGSSWILFILLNLLFISLSLRVVVTMTIKALKDNWAKYRCNPLAIPFSDNPTSDFTFCVQKMQGSYMKYLLQPLNMMFDNLGQLSGMFSSNIFDIRKMFNYIRSQIAFIIKSIFNVIMAIVIEFQRLMIKIKDLFMKIIAIVAVMMNMVDGSIMTAESAWNGPPGNMVRTINSVACFHPDTLMKMKDGREEKMKDLELNDELFDGNKIKAVLKLANFGSDTYYKFENRGLNGSDIFVTGYHFVKGDEGKFIHVKDHPDAIPMPHKEIKELRCLITTDHKIRLGDMTFWDWEDDVLYDDRKYPEQFVSTQTTKLCQG